MRFLITALITSATACLPLQARSAEPVPLVVVPFDAPWGSRRLPVQPAALLPPPPVPGLNQDTPTGANQRRRSQHWCRGGC